MGICIRRSVAARGGRGSALISVLLLTAVLAVLGTAALSLAEGGARVAAARRGIDRSYYAAEGAALIAAERIALRAADGDDAPIKVEAAFDAPYMDTAVMGIEVRREGDGYVIHARAAVSKGECDIQARADEQGRVTHISAAQ